jgi:CheY-specific phosphatase CheX
MPNAANAGLEARVIQLENYFRIGLGVALILGVSGGWLGKVVYDTQRAADEAKRIAENAKVDLQSARNDAISAVKAEASTSVSSEVRAQVPAAMDGRFKELATKIDIVLGPPEFVDYKKLNANFESKCPDGTVVTSWGYGAGNNDVFLRCRRVTITK